jgi:hypothetical protein
LDYFKVASLRAAVMQRLRAYYLFIGVVDDLIDSTQIEAGREILRRLGQRTQTFDTETLQSPPGLVTEILKTHISAHHYADVLAKFEKLYQVVVGERSAETVANFMEKRKAVGRLTAELSYLLIKPLLQRDREDLCRFLMEVGEVGCLIDSVIDLSADGEQSLLGFTPTLKDRLNIIAEVLRKGTKLSWAHPRLIVLFIEAVGDNLLDRLRSIMSIETRPAVASVNESRARVAASESLSSVVWTKP